MDEQMGSGAAITAPGAGCVVVVPCYNEANRLQPQCFSEFLAEDHQVNFLFVNDGSSDATLRILQTLRANHPDRIEVLDKQPNGGKADAVRSGMLHAMARGGVAFTGFWDADLATPLEVIPQLLAKLVENPNLEMIFGSRVRLHRSSHDGSLTSRSSPAFSPSITRMQPLLRRSFTRALCPAGKMSPAQK
jgi:glycosyltransferase involved in cell wall biosynthesis